jgi:hypothetical protein
LPLLCVSCALQSRLEERRYARRLREAVEERVAEYGPAARARLAPSFAAAGVDYPSHAVVLAGFKQERELHLYAADAVGVWRFVRSYPVLAASGVLGPKLMEGDRQVPEGFYRVELLNPFSRHHLSLRLSYPNDFDRARGAEDGRHELGGGIMIHGGRASAGCLAIGDPAVEELFVLAFDVGYENVEVVLSPVDFRLREPSSSLALETRWLPQLYAELREAVRRLPAAPATFPGAGVPPSFRRRAAPAPGYNLACSSYAGSTGCSRPRKRP